MKPTRTWILGALAALGCSEPSTSVWNSADGGEGSSASGPSDPADSSGGAPGDDGGDDDDDSEGSDPGPDDTGQDDTGGDAPKLDVASDDPIPPGSCDCGTDEWSYIWIANSSDGTVSKIDTQTMVEEGRYITRPDRGGNPSRTSVSVNARSVAVANRHGGLVKIWARESSCDEMANGMPGLQTSSGPGDVLPWGQDDCVDWYEPFDSWSTQRPVAWSGRLDTTGCEDEAVWTAGCGGGGPGMGDWFADVEVALLSGPDGALLEELTIPGFSCSGFGPYGGAVAPDGAFWLVVNNGDIARVDADTLDTEVVPKPPSASPYGMTVDKDGRVWVSSYASDVGAARYDPATGSWVTVSGFSGQGGVAQSTDGRIWAGAGNSIAWIDADAATLGGLIPVPNGTVKGVSGDIHGFVWAVTGVAHKIDTATDTIVGNYGGLITPYTYSDMTGAGIQNVACDPEG